MRTTSKDKPFMQTNPPHLKKYIADLVNPEKRIVVCAGLPSTGKTRKAIECGFEEVRKGNYDKVVYIRSYGDLKCGFLPGSLEDKMHIFTLQAETYMEYSTQKDISLFLEVFPADVLKGRRFQNCFVVIDEAEDIPQSESFTILSRIGEGTKYVIIGDIHPGQQHRKIKENSFLKYCTTLPIDDDIGVHLFYERSYVLGDAFTKKLIGILLDDYEKICPR